MLNGDASTYEQTWWISNQYPVYEYNTASRPIKTRASLLQETKRLKTDEFLYTAVFRLFVSVSEKYFPLISKYE